MIWGRRSDELLVYFILNDCFKLSFVMVEVGNLHAKLGGSHGFHARFRRFTLLGLLISNSKIVRSDSFILNFCRISIHGSENDD